MALFCFSRGIFHSCSLRVTKNMVIFSLSLVKGTGCTKVVKMAGPVVLSLSVSCVPYKRSWVYSRTTVVVLSPRAAAPLALLCFRCRSCWSGNWISALAGNLSARKKERPFKIARSYQLTCARARESAGKEPSPPLWENRVSCLGVQY